ncbi:VIT1/CCC1 transporter family protein [Candidatus Woesebacteria bacterium]|nr:VIT1/CCC1 transporter family protein [Candidatus Woesebacteria bacterium]
MKYTREDLRRHIETEHKGSPFAVYLKEIVYGGNDGIVTTFAVVAGFAGAQSSNSMQIGYLAVLLFGLANLFADAASMGLGNFLATRSDQDLYRQEKQKEREEIEKNHLMEVAETKQLLMERGFDPVDAGKLVEIYSKNTNYWADFMMKYELGMEDVQDENPVFTALATFIAFITFGFIPLVPYVFFAGAANTFEYAIAFTAFALVLLGILRWRVTGVAMFQSIGEIVLIGGVSAGIAYFVGTLF